MEFELYLRHLQMLINYKFKDPSLLALALTAAGVEGIKEGNADERKKYDGNRQLALLGDKIVQFIITIKTLFEDEFPDRDRTDKALKSAKLKENLEERARRFELDTHMKLNIRQKGEAKKKTLSTVIDAIFGACYLDCKDLLTVRGVIEQFGLGVDNNIYVDPVTAYQQQNLFSSEVTEGVFNAEPFTGFESTIDSSLADMTLMTSADLNLGLHPLNTTELNTYDSITPEMSETFELLSTRSESIVSGGFREIIEGNSQPEINWTASEFELLLRSSTASSVVTSGSSQTIMGNDDEGFPGIQNIRSMSTESSVVVMKDPVDHLALQVAPSNTGHQSSGRDSGITATGNTSAKRKYTPPSKTKATQLDEYISKQKEICQRRGLPCPEESFNAVITFPTTSGRSTQMIPELKLLYFAIASPESVVALQANVKVGKRDGGSGLQVPQWDLPLPERMMAIEGLGQKMSYIALIRRCHIHQLYLESSVDSLKTSDRFVVNTAKTIMSRRQRVLGNPIHLEDARVSEMIMSELYPNLERASPEYKKKLPFARNMRRLGQRLDLFVEKWGYGIIGLLPFAKDVSNVNTGLDITDNFILKFPDYVFDEFVQRFDQTQGKILCEMSAAVSEIVKAISRGTIDHSTHFGIENLGQEQILNEPRGSRLILESISSITLDV